MQKSVDTEVLTKVKRKSEHREYSIFAMFLKSSEARKGVRGLRRHGFKSADIHMLTPDKQGSRDFVYHQTWREIWTGQSRVIRERRANIEITRSDGENVLP